MRRGALRQSRGWPAAVMAAAILGAGHAALQVWGDLAWFRLEQTQAPLVWWATPSSMIYWLLGAGVIWSLIVGLLADHARAGDRRRWVWRWGGLAIVVGVCVFASYLASRNGVALFEDRIVFRPAILAPLQAVDDADISHLSARCDWVRRPRSLDPDDRIDRPMWSLALRDGRRIEIGGVRGAGLAERSQADWLTAMRRLSRYPVRTERVDPRCVERAVARFPEADWPFVRGLFRS